VPLLSHEEVRKLRYRVETDPKFAHEVEEAAGRFAQDLGEGHERIWVGGIAFDMALFRCAVVALPHPSVVGVGPNCLVLSQERITLTEDFCLVRISGSSEPVVLPRDQVRILALMSLDMKAEGKHGVIHNARQQIRNLLGEMRSGGP